MWKNGRYMFYCLDIFIKKKKKKRKRESKGVNVRFFGLQPVEIRAKENV